MQRARGRITRHERRFKCDRCFIQSKDGVLEIGIFCPRYNWDPLALDPEMTESLARTAPFSSQGEGVVQPRRLRARRSSDGFAGCHRPFPSATTTGWMWVSYPTAARCAPPPRRCFCHLERLLVSVSSVRWHAIGGIERRSSHRHRASSGRPDYNSWLLLSENEADMSSSHSMCPMGVILRARTC